ncbi:MAG: hypothetical protein ACI9FU_000961 [Granulosicoccus sp.]|jgi:hypothetical protein
MRSCFKYGALGLLMIILLTAGSSAVFGQVPGYGGHKFTLEANASTFPVVKNIFRGNKPKLLDESGAPLPKIQFPLHLEYGLFYTVGRHIDLGLRYTRESFDTNYDLLHFVHNDTLVDYNGNASTVREANTGLANPYQTTESQRFEFIIRLYPKDNIAPLGLNFQLGYGMYVYEFESEDPLDVVVIKEDVVEPSQDVVGHITGERSIISTWNFAMNRKSIIAGSVFYSFGTEFNFVRYRVFQTAGNPSTYDHIAEKQGRYLAFSNMFAIKLGIGIFL